MPNVSARAYKPQLKIQSFAGRFWPEHNMLSEEEVEFLHHIPVSK